MAIVEVTRPIVGGVDTHLDLHVAAAIDPIGGLLGVESFPTTPAGYHALASWLGAFGPIDRVGVEGTGTYGAGLARHLSASGITVIEVDRPNRQERRRNGKSDELDAIEAARAALSRRAKGHAKGHAKGGTGNVEALRALLVAKRSARSIRIRSTGQLRHLVITAPDELRVRLTGLTSKALVAQASVLRARPGSDPVRHATKTAIITLARRVQAINAEIAVLDRHIDTLVRATAPGLVAVYGVGADTATILLVAAGDNATRIHSEAAWAPHDVRTAALARLERTAGFLGAGNSGQPFLCPVAPIHGCRTRCGVRLSLQARGEPLCQEQRYRIDGRCRVTTTGFRLSPATNLRYGFRSNPYTSSKLWPLLPSQEAHSMSTDPHRRSRGSG
jgi:transposase